MAVASETVALEKLDIATGVEIAVAIPVFAANEIVVTYGRAALEAVQVTDYTVTLLDESVFNTFSITPTASLLTKIDNLILADDTEVNRVVVRRKMGLTSPATAANAQYTSFLATQLDRAVARIQQMQEQLNRSLMLPDSYVGATKLLTLNNFTVSGSLYIDGDGKVQGDGPDLTTLDASLTAAVAAALGYATAAENARDATLTAYDNFDDRYLGAKAVAPTLDNDGNALVGGTLYYDTVLEAMQLWTGSAWVAAYVSGAEYPLLSNNGSDYTAATFRTNLSLYSTAQVDAALSAKAPTASPTFTGTVTVPDSSFSFAKLAGAAIASVAEWLANTANKILTPATVWGAMAEVAITETNLTTGIDLSSGIDFAVTLTASRTMGNFSNVKVGQRGRIRVVQNGTGGWVLTKGSNHKTPGGGASVIALAANAESYLYYDCVAASKVLLSGSPLAWS